MLEAPILIVDDREENVALLRSILEHAGHTSLHTTTDSSRAVELFEQVHPELVLLDLHMPEPDGFAILRQLEALTGPDDYLPVFVITAELDEHARQEALSLGAKDFITKPVNATEMVLRMRNLLHARLLHTRERQMNETLERKVAERTRELEEAQFEILDRLALVGDFRDDATGQHARRVATSAMLVARSIGLPAGQANLYRWAAGLHDIGKIAIPDSILLKPGPLTVDEFEEVKMHTQIGAQVLSGSRFPILELARLIAFTHHERWDGRGYMGMAGEDIPLPGRIVAVCDVFDALVHERPYKHAWRVEDALAEIDRQRGKMFEPRVADAFLALPRAVHCTVRRAA
ncbi:MAG: response regulator [Chloroflexi bacterium]|nr:response regulator [Chloroflexota bacterium]